VSPSGDVLPCSSFGHPESLGNLLREPFLAIWQSREARFFRSKEMMPGGCASCPEAAACQGACVLYWREKGVEELGRDETSRPRLPEGFRDTPAARAD
jgi:radical SAM protein with 4Fe4S-binding SPASM domain